MKNRIPVILIVAFFLAGTALNGQTNGILNYTITTKPTNTSYSPKHVLAIWVEDNNGNLIKNLEVSASTRRQYLYTWNNKSGGNATDVTTGSTLQSHVSHSKSWDCRDKSGVLVADGTYKLVTEFTSEHAPGPISTTTFTKAGGAISINPANSTYFSNISLVYTPSATLIEKVYSDSWYLDAFPNPAMEYLRISYNLSTAADVDISLYNLNGQLVKTIQKGQAVPGKSGLSWTIPSDISAGTYVLILQSDRLIATKKVVIGE